MSDILRFNYLSWRILECKLAYYYPNEVSHKWKQVTDPEYDMMEVEYKALAKDLSQPPTATDMVGFDFNRPACRLVFSKWGKHE